MKEKSSLKKTIIMWSLYGVLMIATILVFAFSTEIFGGDLKKIRETVSVRDPEPIF